LLRRETAEWEERAPSARPKNASREIVPVVAKLVPNE